jgi:hypothetical protein
VEIYTNTVHTVDLLVDPRTASSVHDGHSDDGFRGGASGCGGRGLGRASRGLGLPAAVFSTKACLEATTLVVVWHWPSVSVRDARAPSVMA